MAVKIVRQENRIALLGAPVSAAALAPGGEGAPAAFRNAGLISILQSIGYEVTDMGDDPPQVYREDGESPRARNLPSILASLEALRPRVEVAVKSRALPLILGGGCSLALATVAGLRRYFRHVSLVYANADVDLQTPATTSSGCVDGMVVSHLVGRGASELVRFWSEPPLVREPDLALFGVSRLDPAEEQALQNSPLRRYLVEDVRRKSPTRAASEAIERIHGDSHEFVLHFDVDVIGDFPATNLPAPGGLRLEEVREALDVFAAQKHLAAIEVTGYNPSRDPDGSCVKLVIDLLVGVLSMRREQAKTAAAGEAVAPGSGTGETSGVKVTEANEAAMSTAPVQAWSSEMLEETPVDGRAEPIESSAAASSDEPQKPSS